MGIPDEVTPASCEMVIPGGVTPRLLRDGDSGGVPLNVRRKS